MYVHKKNRANMRIPPRNTRAADRDVFHVQQYNICKYKNSWNNLPIDLTRSLSLPQFKMGLKRLYKKFKEED